VRVTPRSVHNECAGVLANGLGESFWSFLDNDIPPTILTGERSVEGGPVRVLSVPELGNGDLVLEAGFTLYEVMRRCCDSKSRESYGLALNGAAIDSNISKICKELLGTVLRLYKLEQIGRIIDKL
jgi:hypothetical protein